ncbi:hypothetical protein F5Y19DRAFT_471261 [Xylariaceae sp. FL1651]|nr:hypothetical protein F5Y19DRAFT_471261 [Xylariaceae sp. FL1651]
MHLANWPSFLAAFAVLASTHPVGNDTVASAPFWAQYCSDDACSENCGTSLQISDPTCRFEYPRKSIRFHGAPYGAYAIIISSAVGCPCQTACIGISKWGMSSNCLNISEYASDMSFRFISGGCPKNQC